MQNAIYVKLEKPSKSERGGVLWYKSTNSKSVSELSHLPIQPKKLT